MVSPERLRLAWHRRRSRHYFISFPKCGRTWTKTVVERYLQALWNLPDFTFETSAPWVRTGRMRRVPRLVFMHPASREPRPEAVARLRRRLRGRRVALMVRDPRDVVYTYYFRLTRRFADPEATALEIPDFVRHPVFGVGRIVDFMNDWHRALDDFDDPLRLRFEDVRRAPVEEIGRFIAFLGAPVETGLLRDTLARTPDRTTRGIESDDPDAIDWTRPAIDAILDPGDLDYVESQIARLDPGLGYQVRRETADHRD